ncbi:MAG: hypothetical protein ACYDDF_00750 [Thermoplasmatota archaeon]
MAPERDRGEFWRLFGGTILATVGIIAFLLGATEWGLILMGTPGRALQATGLVLGGLLLLALPVTLGVRQLLQSEREKAEQRASRGAREADRGGADQAPSARR